MPLNCNPGKMRKMKGNKKLNKKNAIVWVKKKECRRWLGGVIQEKWGWPAAGSKLSQNWQSKSAKAHPGGQGSRSAGKGWTEENGNTLAGQGWSLAGGEKSIKEEQDFGWEKFSKKVGKGNDWRDTTTEQRWNLGGAGHGFGQRMWKENKGSRQDQQGRRTRMEPEGEGIRRQGTKQRWKAGETKEKQGAENSWKGSWRRKQNIGDQLLDLGWGQQTNNNGHGWTAVYNNDYY